MALRDLFFKRQADGTSNSNGNNRPSGLSEGRPVAGQKILAGYSNILANAAFYSDSATRYQPERMIQIIVDYNPEASEAAWQFIRMIGQGAKIVVEKTVDGKKQPDEDVQKVLDERLKTYALDYGGGMGQLIDTLSLMVIERGAVAMELEVSDDLRDVADWCPVDPHDIEFEINDRSHFIPSVHVNGELIPLSQDQFRYVPLDPRYNDPRGRSMFLPALEAVFFQAEVLRDLKKVAHTTGNPRIHFKLMEDIVRQSAPGRLQGPGKESELKIWMDQKLSDIATAYSEIEADDAFFTYDYVEVNPVSAGKGTYDLSSIIEVVENEMIAGLKQLPIMLGRMRGSGLAHGTVQWQVFAQTIIALREVIASLVSWAATQTLRIWGYNSTAKLVFDPIRIQDRVKEAQAEGVEIQNALMMEAAGWVSMEELAMKFVGHKPVAPPRTVPIDAGSASQDTSEEMEEGEAESDDTAAENRTRVLPVSDESKYFDRLPQWMKARIRKAQEGIIVSSDIRRQKIKDS
jgi:hypothetical protein